MCVIIIIVIPSCFFHVVVVVVVAERRSWQDGQNKNNVGCVKSSTVYNNKMNVSKITNNGLITHSAVPVHYSMHG
jgi:hypothetical protein